MQDNKFKQFLCSGAGRITLILIFYAIFLLLITALSTTNATPVLYAIAAVSAFFGWKFLNKLQPDIFLIMPIIGWIIFFVIKGILAILVGIFVAPYVMAKAVANMIQGFCE